MGIAISPIQIDSRVSDFIAKPRKMLIDGKWVNAASGKTFATYNPATGEILAQVAEGDRADIDAGGLATVDRRLDFTPNPALSLRVRLRSNRGSTIGLVPEGLPRLLPWRGENDRAGRRRYRPSLLERGVLRLERR